MLTGKKLTKLLNKSYRSSIIESIRREAIDQMKIAQYARYLADTQIINRSREHKDDKAYGYGFSPINFVCAIHRDGHISKTLFEFNSVNHFLVTQDGDSAVEVLTCILIDLAKNDKTITSFDPDIIDAELVKIEREYLAEQKKKELEEADKSDLSGDNDDGSVEQSI